MQLLRGWERTRRVPAGVGGRIRSQWKEVPIGVCHAIEEGEPLALCGRRMVHVEAKKYSSYHWRKCPTCKEAAASRSS
jgi:hypothetical protein